MDKKNNHQGLYRVAYICYSEVEKASRSSKKEDPEILGISKREEEYI
jgi:hypothetical protein